MPSSPGAAVEADCQECTPNSGNCPALSARCRPETEPAELQTPAARRREEPREVTFIHPIHKLLFCNPQSFLKDAMVYIQYFRKKPLPEALSSVHVPSPRGRRKHPLEVKRS